MRDFEMDPFGRDLMLWAVTASALMLVINVKHIVCGLFAGIIGCRLAHRGWRCVKCNQVEMQAIASSIIGHY